MFTIRSALVPTGLCLSFSNSFLIYCTLFPIFTSLSIWIVMGNFLRAFKMHTRKVSLSSEIWGRILFDG